MKQKSTAIPIRCVDFSDSSQVVSLFTRDHGLVEGIAKGAHRTKSSFQGPFDLAVLYEVVFLDRRSAAGLAILTEAAVVDGFRGLRVDWNRHVAASHLVEFLRAVSTAEPEPELFDLAVRTFSDLSEVRGALAGSLLARFDVGAMLALGFLAPLDSCVECGRRRPEGAKPAWISLDARGVICRHCREEKPRTSGVTLPGAAMQLLDRLARDGAAFEEAGVEEVEEGWKAHGRPVAQVLSRLRTNVLERELVLLKSSRSWI